MRRDTLIDAIDDRITRFTTTGDVAAVLEEAGIAEARELARLDDGGLVIAHSLAMYHHCRLVAAQQQGPSEPDEADIRSAFGYFRVLYEQAPDMLPDGVLGLLLELWDSAGLRSAWATRAADLLAEGRRRNDIHVIDDAVALLDQVVGPDADPDGDRASYLTNLGLALRIRFLLGGHRADIDRAVLVATAAVDAAPTEQLLRGFRSNLAIAYMARFERYGCISDLDRAITELRACVDGDAQGRPGRLSNLAASLASRFTITGDRTDIDDALGLFATAVDLAVSTRGKADLLSNRAAAHTTRYNHTGDTADLGLAVECAREAVRVVGSDADALPAMLNNLGLALRSRYQRTRQPADIVEAVTQLRRTVQDFRVGPTDSARYLSNLCSALRVSFELTRETAEIDEAVRCGRAATATLGTQNAVLARYQSNLGAALSSRFTATGARTDLDDAVTASRAAATLVPLDDPIRATVLANLGLALRRRAEHDVRTAADDLAAAAAAYAESAATPSAPPLVRATSAQDCGRIHADRGEWQAAVAMYESAISLLGEVTDTRLVADDQQYHLRRLAGLGCAAAGAALALEPTEPAKAIALLERGRGVLLAQLLATSGELAALRETRPDLADAFQRVQRELNQMVTPEQDMPETLSARRIRLGAERDALVAEVRTVPGWAHFLLPRVDDELTTSPVSGPVVAINLAENRCDALLVSAAGTRLLPLPGLLQSDAIEQANLFLRAVYERGPDTDRTITAVQSWMWETFAERILDELDLTDVYSDDDIPPRLWWLPTGALTVLPIHAAGRPTAGQNVCDRVVSSYTPTLRALREARRRIDHPAPVERPLIVAVPAADGNRPLHGARREAGDVARRFPSDADTTILIDVDATRDRILESLVDRTWVHFACHADTDPANPFDSHLLVHDGTLSIRDIATLRIAAARLAYLSACTTAFGGTELSDEGIHISSAFQLAGFPAVIGTLWQVKDIAAETMASRCYDELASREPAYAVHRALRKLRLRYTRYPYMWASHVHIGP